MCFINSTPLIEIIDIGATHSFISVSCVERLSLVATSLLQGIIIDTPTNGLVTTSLVCAKCPVNFGNVDFELDLVCLPLKHMDMIFGMDWMLTFGVSINCLTKSVTFFKPVVELGGKFLTAEQVKKSLDGEASVFMMLMSWASSMALTFMSNLFGKDLRIFLTSFSSEIFSPSESNELAMSRMFM